MLGINARACESEDEEAVNQEENQRKQANDRSAFADDADDSVTDMAISALTLDDDEETKQDVQAKTKPMTTHGDSDKDLDDIEESGDVREFANRYTADLIVEYQDTDDNLLLHWGVGREHAGEWARADDAQLPTGSTRWPDDVATQTPFVKDAFYPEFRSLQLVFEWTEGQETPI